MPEIIPNWHPIFVHFTVALFSVASAGYLISLLFPAGQLQSQLLTVARWNLWLGMGLTVMTLLTGGYAYNTVIHDTPSHLAMTDHRNWALGTAALFAIATVCSMTQFRGRKETSFLFVVLLIVASMALGATAWRGGELVYRYGLGVLSLPESSRHEHVSDEKGHNQEQKDDIDPHQLNYLPEIAPQTLPSSVQAPQKEPHEHKAGGSSPHIH